MCEKQKRIDDLENKVRALESQREQQLDQREKQLQREAELFKTIAEGKNLQSQTAWRPTQVILVGIIVPTAISLIALATALSN
ncbi:hypothetical protein OPW39_15695 [Vibrio europaeus]|uniref:hypothetical protein n=1 Tax=Vibrio europaeus TaxID=300876 RepID=UPI00233F2AEC|nr:hypothetical protein [Vibrio europaeus]MDC5870251.1 hypothetical protein [Vibrio europaeus]